MSDINTPRDLTFQTTESTPRNLADVLADELEGIAQAIADGGSTDYDDLTHRPEINSVILTGDKSADDLSLAMQEDLTSIKATGTTNATGSTITSGTFFYLNGKLCKAKADIASGATFTLNTNYEVVTAGGLNSLNSAIAVETDTIDGVVFTKQGNFANVNINNISAAVTSALTIPQKYRPKNNFYLSAVIQDINTAKNYWGYVLLYNTGSIAAVILTTYGSGGSIIKASNYYIYVQGSYATN